MSNKIFEDKLSEYISRINNKLDEISSIPNLPQKSVYEAMRYSLMAGGKRVRPVITAAVAEMLGGDVDTAVCASAAIECVHTYSLIHDDLPCMDDDDLRRGMATCHKVFPESTALLAGDGLLNMAFELLSDDEYLKVPADMKIRLISALSKASGTRGMIGGQILDLEGESRNNLTIHDLELMHRGKTGAMISVSVEFGCILCSLYDKTSDEFVKIREFSENLGLAFQIKDDILDVIGDETVLGKPIGSDKSCGKNTFVTILGIEEAEKCLAVLTDRAVSALDIFGDRAWFLKELADALLRRDK